MDYEEFLQPSLRLAILRTLSEQVSYTSNESVIGQVVESYGHHKSRDHIRSAMRWLEDVGAVTLKDVEGYLIATITEKGLDHVESRIAIDDIKRPRPGE